MKSDYMIIDSTNLTNQDKANKQCNRMALNTIYNAIDSKVFEQIKYLERTSEVWKRFEETYEGTSAIKSAKLYILKDKLTSFKMKDDERHTVWKGRGLIRMRRRKMKTRRRKV
jgi:hypothetical protein